MNARATRFPLFDSLRAIAALSVLAFHGLYQAFLAAHAQHSPLVPYAARLNAGVVLFFAISAFLLYRPFVRARLRGEELPAVGAYAWRRFLRIVPGYWVALTVVALVLDVPGVFSGSGILTYYGFAQVYGSDTLIGGIGQAWSLGVEVVFYLLVPVWALVMRQLPDATRSTLVAGELVALAALALAGLAFQAWTLTEVDPNVIGGLARLLSMPNFLDCFALGMGLAVLSAHWEDRPSPRGLAVLDRFPGVAWVGSAAAFWAASTQIGQNGRPGDLVADTTYFVSQRLYVLVAILLLLPVVFGDQHRGLLRRVLANRVLLYVGLVAYGVYLYHLAVFGQLALWGLTPRTVTDELVWLLLGTAGAVGLGTLSYYVVERPALALKRLVGPGRGTPDQPGAVSAPVAPLPPGN